MNLEKKLKKVANYLLIEHHIVKVKVEQINYGGILKDRHIIVMGGSGDRIGCG